MILPNWASGWVPCLCAWNRLTAPKISKIFFQDFERYLKQTATTSDSDKLNSLIDHTTGEAHAFYRTLTPAPNYAETKTALEDRFGLNIQEKRHIKSRFYSTKQLSGEPLTCMWAECNKWPIRSRCPTSRWWKYASMAPELSSVPISPWLLQIQSRTY